MAVKKPAKRFDVVFIRKSTKAQDERGQKANVESLLKQLGVSVAPEHWFEGTVSRRKVRANPEFARLMALVESGRVGTVYIEAQDRWGTADRPELFTLLGILRENETRLFDLRAKKDLTERDLATEMLAFVSSIKSEQELNDIAYRSLRTRVNNFKANGSWPTGTHPFGYGKACYSEAGELRWVWQPISRTEGQEFVPNEKGKLIPSGPSNRRVRRKEKRDRIVLVPNTHPTFVDSVRLIFDLYTRVGLSRRQISTRLNQEGWKFYTRDFTHTFVTQILTNPVYVGEIHFGKNQTGVSHTFDSDGVVLQRKRSAGKQVRGEADRIVKQDTHEPLIERKVWELAQHKLKSEQERSSYAPRNPDYYLKQIFVCGHCGKGMTGRTETHPGTGEKTVIYVCSQYVAGRCNGHTVECGYQRITHAEAERLLLAKIEEMGIEFKTLASTQARDSIQRRLALLGSEHEGAAQKWHDWITEGVNAFADHLNESGQQNQWPEIRKMKRAAYDFYCDGPSEQVNKKLANLQKLITAAEQRSVRIAKEKVRQLTDELTATTLSWAKASEFQQTILKPEMDRMEAEIGVWKPRTVPLADRLESLHRTVAARVEEREELIRELPNLTARERGEAFRRVFDRVTLFWDRQFCPARSENRKTDRPGRNKFTLREDRIQWGFTPCEILGSW